MAEEPSWQTHEEDDADQEIDETVSSKRTVKWTTANIHKELQSTKRCGIAGHRG